LNGDVKDEPINGWENKLEAEKEKHSQMSNVFDRPPHKEGKTMIVWGRGAGSAWGCG